MTHHARRNVTVYGQLERPDIQVLVDGTWCRGEARMRWQAERDAWWYQVQWLPPGASSARIGAFPADQVRVDEIDYSAGR